MNPTTARFCLLAMLACTHPVLAQTNNTARVADADTTLYEDPAGTLANGAGTGLFVGRVGANGGGGRRRTLLRVDLTGSVPTGAKILSARLELFVTQSQATAPVLVYAHRVLQPWSEGAAVAPSGGGSGGMAVPGETTWLHSNYPGTLWSTPGGDFDPTPSFTFWMPPSGLVLTDALPGLIADVQDMVDQPGNNHGWVLMTDETQTGTARRIASREGGPIPPALQFSWVAEGNTGTIGLGTLTPLGHCAVAIAGPATGGASLPITYASLPPASLGANFFSLSLVPGGVTLAAGTRAYLAPGSIVPGNLFLSTGGGAASSSVTVPAGFPGTLIAMQAAVVDGSSLGFATTNAAVMVTQ